MRKVRSESISSNASSLLSIKRQRKKTRSTHSKAQETIDTAPFTIESPPVYPPKIERKKLSDDDEKDISLQNPWESERELPSASEIEPEDDEPKSPIRIESIPKRRVSSPEIKPEEKTNNDEWVISFEYNQSTKSHL